MSVRPEVTSPGRPETVATPLASAWWVDALLGDPPREPSDVI